MRFSRFSVSLLAAALLAGPTASPARPAAATNLHVDYRITLAGLTLGEADLAGTFEDDRYRVQLKAQLTGLAGMFTSSGRGGGVATGTISGTRLLSSGFAATGKSGGSERVVRMAVTGGNAGDVDITPPFEPRPDRVPVSDADRRNIVDPLGGLLAVVPNRAKADDAANCNHTVPVFDGTQRFDVVLSYAETKAVQRPGFTGNVIVCNARYVPISGHRPERWAVKFMAQNRDMSVWLAPVQGTRLLVPLRISVMTFFGMSVVEAERWRVE